VSKSISRSLRRHQRSFIQATRNLSTAFADTLDALRARVKNPRTPHALGEWGERRARRYLERRGYTTIASNWRSPHGEIDLVAWDHTTLVFIEVKTRRRATSAAFPPLAAVDHAKRLRLIRLARLFLLTHAQRRSRRQCARIRFDIVTVTVEHPRIPPDIRHYIDASGSIGCWHDRS